MANKHLLYQRCINDDEKLKGALAYILSWLTGIIVLLISDDNKF